MKLHLILFFYQIFSRIQLKCNNLSLNLHSIIITIQSYNHHQEQNLWPDKGSTKPNRKMTQWKYIKIDSWKVVTHRNFKRNTIALATYWGDLTHSLNQDILWGNYFQMCNLLVLLAAICRGCDSDVCSKLECRQKHKINWLGILSKNLRVSNPVIWKPLNSNRSSRKWCGNGKYNMADQD